MKLAVMQPYFFPYIGYFQLIHEVDKFVLYDDVNFINKGWINRNNILVAGQANLFTIPLQKASQNVLINQISIMEDSKWKSKFLKTLEMAYKKAQFYNVVFPMIENIIEYKSASVSNHIHYSIQVLKKYLDIDTPIVASSSVYKNISLRGQERILDICIQEGAKTYVNPIGGTELYSKALFDKNQIELKFLKPRSISYKQYTDSFVPYLSIIDVLMFNSSVETNMLMKQYDLISNALISDFGK